MSTKKGGLGRGLDALFADAAPVRREEPDENITPDASEMIESAPAAKGSGKSVKSRRQTSGRASDPASEPSDRVIYIDINDIKPNKDQPRKHFDEEKLKELADSIISNGVIQPIVVRNSGTGYELVAGERRWRASRLAGLTEVPCIVREFTDDQNMLVAIIENMQREDLDPIEEAAGLKTMMKKLGMTQAEVAKAVGKSRAYIANSVRLLGLPDEIQAMVADGRLSAAHGRTIAGIDDEKKRTILAERVAAEGLSVRATEKLAERAKSAPHTRRRKQPDKPQDVLTAEDELRRIMGTKVNIIGTPSTGRLEIEYYSLDELNRIIDMLRALE